MSLFKKAETKPTRLKLFVYGDTGTGKTITALSFPKPVVIDTEKGTTLYGQYNKGFDVLITRDLQKINQALDELLQDPNGYKTLVFDSITIAYEHLLLEYEKRMRIKTGKMDYTIQPMDYKFIKTEMKNINHKILALDLNLVVIARSKVAYSKDEFMKVEGIKPDCPDYIPFDYDVVIELQKDPKNPQRSIAKVVKDRTFKLPATFEYSFQKFAEYLGMEGLDREPLLINQQKNIEEINARNVEIEFNGKKIKTAGITGEQLKQINNLIASNPEEAQEKLKEMFYVDSFLDLREDEAETFIKSYTQEQN